MRRIAAVLSVIGMVGLAAPSARAAELSFALKIEHGQVPANMRLIRVMQGDKVTLNMVSDQRLFLHLHGYEIMFDVNGLTQISFTANLTGRFPVHLHAGPGEADGHAHEETLVTIEVYPR
jgi:hypothetical protein